MELDALDQLAAGPFDGFLVRKDLVRKYSRAYPVPTYVVEFLLGRYCASTNEEEIREGLTIVEQQLDNRTVQTGKEELFKARARDDGSVKFIDIVKAKLDAKNDCYVAEVPSLALKDVPISDNLVKEHERMLTDGFYAEVTLGYDAVIAQEKKGRPFYIESLRPIQLSSANALDSLREGRRAFSTAQWIDFLIRSVGLEPTSMNERAKKVVLLRMIPFVEPNYNLVELGPRGTGKSHIYQQISPYSHLISGGKATVAKMFVNNASGQRGFVCLYDVVCFDEVSGVSFDQKDGVNIMKGYMASGEFSRGKESIRAQGGIVMVGNFDVDVEQQQRKCLRSEFRNTHFSFHMGADGVEQFVSTPELHSDDAIDSDPLPPGQVWTISPGADGSGPGLHRIEVNAGPGSGVKILNIPASPEFRESVKLGEQNFYTKARSLVGDRDPRSHEFSIQMRAFDNNRSGHGVGMAVLVAMTGSLLGRNTKGGV